MSFIDPHHRFSYMPPGSYAILPDGKPLFMLDLPKETKERFIKDLEEMQKERDKLLSEPDSFPW